MNAINERPAASAAAAASSIAAQPRAGESAGTERVLVTLTVGGQLCGVPVGAVRDVLDAQKIARIPLAPPEVAGSLNLRGRIVTAIDLARRLRLPPPPPAQAGARMSVVVELAGELYSLLVDGVGEVMTLPERLFEENPPTLDACWRGVSDGVYRLESVLLVLLDVGRLLDLGAPARAATA
ncbi:MAG: chemotaxis protein CheW [Alphaproteobacteria bacterium]|nr:chemotaxis protein CheW [Alphaproteobacteria bacterium]